MKNYLKIFVFLFLLLLVSGCSKLKVKKNLKIEVNSTVKYSDLIEQNDKITLINGDDLVDTSKLGKKDVIVSYKVNDKEEKKIVTVNIVDKTAPVIEALDQVSTYKTKTIDLLSNVKVTDNSNEQLDVKVVGEYDINTVGEYKLKYEATDSSGNKGTKDFTLTVKDLTVKVGGYYMYKTKKEWIGVNFKDSSKVLIAYNFCPGSGCGGYSESGTYKVENDKVTIKLTSNSSEDGTKKMNKTLVFTITDESKTKYSNNTYTWNKSFN